MDYTNSHYIYNSIYIIVYIYIYYICIFSYIPYYILYIVFWSILNTAQNNFAGWANRYPLIRDLSPILDTPQRDDHFHPRVPYLQALVNGDSHTSMEITMVYR